MTAHPTQPADTKRLGLKDKAKGKDTDKSKSEQEQENIAAYVKMLDDPVERDRHPPVSFLFQQVKEDEFYFGCSKKQHLLTRSQLVDLCHHILEVASQENRIDKVRPGYAVRRI